MSPSQKDDYGQECKHYHYEYRVQTAWKDGLPESVSCGNCGKRWSFADHRDAQQLREQLEEAVDWNPREGDT